MPRSALPSFVHDHHATRLGDDGIGARDGDVGVLQGVAQVCPRRAGERGRDPTRPPGEPSVRWKSAPTSSFFQWIAGTTMWLGDSPASCTMRSPRSVSMTSMPFAARYGLRPHSSVSIDLLLATRVPPAAAMMSRTMRLCSAASRAQCTVTPLRCARALELLQQFSERSHRVCLQSRRPRRAAPPTRGRRRRPGRGACGRTRGPGRARRRVRVSLRNSAAACGCSRVIGWPPRATRRCA